MLPLFGLFSRTLSLQSSGVFYTYSTSQLGVALFQVLKDTCSQVASILDRERVRFTCGGGGDRIQGGDGVREREGRAWWAEGGSVQA